MNQCECCDGIEDVQLCHDVNDDDVYVLLCESCRSMLGAEEQ